MGPHQVWLREGEPPATESVWKLRCAAMPSDVRWRLRPTGGVTSFPGLRP